MKTLIFIFLTTFGFFASAGELQGVKLPDQITLEGKNLTLNGMGLRTVVRFGFTVKVYVAGLFLESKSKDTDEILNSPGIKRLVMTFVRPVDRDALLEAFRNGYYDTCVAACENKGSQFSKFAEHVVSVRKDNQITLTFYPDKLEIDSTGPNAKKQMINDKDLSKNLLSVFIHKVKSPGKDFRAGILGIK